MALQTSLFATPVRTPPPAAPRVVMAQAAPPLFADTPAGGGTPFGFTPAAPAPTSTPAETTWFADRVFAPTPASSGGGVPFGYVHTVDANPALVPPPLVMGDGSPMFGTPEYNALHPAPTQPNPSTPQNGGLTTEMVVDDAWEIGTGQLPPEQTHRPAEFIPGARTAAVLAALAGAAMIAYAFLGRARPGRRVRRAAAPAKRSPRRAPPKRRKR